MAKTYLPAGGGLTFKSVLRFVGPSPLDGRGVVDTLSNISGQAYKTTFGGSEFEDVASYYEGMLVVTKDTGKLYVLNGGTFKEVTPDLSGIQETLDAIPNTYVPKTLKINDKALNADITLSASDVGLGNVTNLAASGYFTVLTSDVTDAIKITVGGTTKEIKVATLKTSLGLGDLAYKDSLSYSDVGALSATGTAVKASALALTQAIGDTKTPVYFNAEGKPVALGYTIGKSIPADAVFTDTKVSLSNVYGDEDGEFYIPISSITEGTTQLHTIKSNDREHSLRFTVQGGNTYVHADTFVGSFKGVAEGAIDLTETPSINIGKEDSNTITITAGTKTSQPFTVPYSREAKKLSGGRVSLKFYCQSSDTPIHLRSINVSYLRQLVFNVDALGEILSCNMPQDDFLQISLEMPSGVPELSDELFRVINVKSNGFTIPGTSNNGPDKRWVSNNKIKAGTISNIEVLITAE